MTLADSRFLSAGFAIFLRSRMNYRSLLSLAFLLLSSLMAKAGGSIHRDDIQELLKTNPVLANLINKGLALEEVGGAIRLGRHMGDLGGARIGPYEFPAKTKPEGTKVAVILHTEVTVTDAKGKILDLGNLTPEMSGLKISEKLLSYEVKAEAAAKSIGDYFRELGDDSLQWINAEFESDDEPGFGEVRRGFLQGELRRVILDVNMGDHYTVSVDVFSGEPRKPVFVLVTETSWRFVAPEKTEETVKERRLYFENKKLTKVLEKSYKFREESQRVAKRDAAVNKKVPVGSLSSSKWYGLSEALFYGATAVQLREHAEAFAEFK